MRTACGPAATIQCPFKEKNMAKYIVACMFLLSACAALFAQSTAPAAAPPDGIPKEWVLIKAGTEFTFWAPSDFKQKRFGGVDSFVGEYESPTMKISFDYGWYSNPMDTSEYQREALTLDGRAAFLARSEKGVGVYVPNAAETKGMPKSTDKLYFFVTCDKATTDQATLLLKSIQFTAPAPATAKAPATTKP
jgi:hypothetical protein